MNFWERVSDLLEKKDINKKTLAIEAKFNPSNITKGIKNNNIPSAETAVRIADILGVSVEYLVTGKTAIKNNALIEKSISLHQKYHSVIDTLENLPIEKQKSVIQIIEECALIAK